MDPAISVEGICKIFETGRGAVHALEDVNLSVAENEFLSIVGPSGCGKTTFINLIAGFLECTKGKIAVRGEEVRGINPRCVMVFQEYALFPWKNVLENVEFGLKMQKVDKEKRQKIAQTYIDLVGLTGFGNRYPRELSGGMQQRVAIARAYASNPEILLMDEPFGSLDFQTREVMQNFLMETWEKERRTVIFITHNIDEAILLAEKVVVFTARPGTVKAIVDVNLPRPRSTEALLTEEFLKCKTKVWKLVKEEVLKKEKIIREVGKY